MSDHVHNKQLPGCLVRTFTPIVSLLAPLFALLAIPFKRWWFWGGALLILVAICAGYLFIPAERSRITQANFDKIQLGMVKNEVEDLLGQNKLGWLIGKPNGKWLHWPDDDGNEIDVYFDRPNGAVAEKDFRHTELSSWEKIEHRIERRVQALWP
jgi:hypothetical protein